LGTKLIRSSAYHP
jgi:hypothetical protein